ncbi:unnamed protein product, partial [Staurois parvus]
MRPCRPRFAWARELIHLNGLPCHAGKKSLHFFGKCRPHGNLGSQYGCVFQCGQHAIRTNGTHPRVHISLCGWCGCTDFHADPQRHHPHRCEPRVIML